MQVLLDDTLVWTPEYKRLPREVLNIPSLYMMGHAKFNKAWDALETHYHNYMEVVVVINGSQQYLVNDTLYLLHGGNLFITYPGEVHGNGKMPQNVCEFIWFQLDLTQPDHFLGLPDDLARRLYRQIAECRKRTVDVSYKDMELLQSAWASLRERNDDGRLRGYSYFLNFLVQIFGSEETQIDNRIITPDIQHALRFIESNLTSDISIPDIAAACKLSASRFKAKFKVQLGITPLAYLNTLKIDMAKSLLKNTKKPITEIAFTLNFSSSNYFTAVFKRYTGYSPSEFRCAKFDAI